MSKLLNGIELEDMFPWLCGQFVVTVAKYFPNVLSITLIKLNLTLSIALLTKQAVNVADTNVIIVLASLIV